jgi:hypothetical protein
MESDRSHRDEQLEKSNVHGYRHARKRRAHSKLGLHARVRPKWGTVVLQIRKRAF